MRYYRPESAVEKATGEVPVEQTLPSVAAAAEPQTPVDLDMDKDLPACYNGTCAVNEWQSFTESELNAARGICGMASGQFAESNCPRLALTAACVELSPSPAELPAPEQPQEVIDQEARQ